MTLHWALLTIGVVYLITEATIAAPLRIAFARRSPFRTAFVYCRACVGFWVGLAVGFLGLWPFDQQAPLWTQAIFSGIAAMALGWLNNAIAPNHAAHIERPVLDLPAYDKDDDDE